MAETPEARLARLEQQLHELQIRVLALERLLGAAGAEHPADRGTVERKVVYDWQA